MNRMMCLIPTVLVILGCQKPQPTFAVKTESDPSPATLAFKGRALGKTPTTILLDRIEDIPMVQAEFQGQAPVEQRVRFLPDGRVELSFLFGEGRSPMAKAMGLARVLVFEYASGMTFDINKAELKDNTLPLLQRQAGLLQTAFKDIPIHVCGHTDSTGQQDLNLDLSLRRAKAVVEYLIRQGVGKDRLMSQGFAAAYPLAPNTTEEGRALNRRTEIVLGQ